MTHLLALLILFLFIGSFICYRYFRSSRSAYNPYPYQPSAPDEVPTINGVPLAPATTFRVASETYPGSSIPMVPKKARRSKAQRKQFASRGARGINRKDK